MQVDEVSVTRVVRCKVTYYEAMQRNGWYLPTRLSKLVTM